MMMMMINMMMIKMMSSKSQYRDLGWPLSSEHYIRSSAHIEPPRLSDWWGHYRTHIHNNPIRSHNHYPDIPLYQVNNFIWLRYH